MHETPHYLANNIKYNLPRNTLMKTIAALLTISIFTISCTQAGDNNYKLNTEDEKAFYSIGYNWASKLKTFNLSDNEIKAVLKGVAASSKGDKAEVNIQAYSTKVNTMLQSRMASTSVTTKEQGKKFIANYLKKNTNAKKTKSGLVYETLKAGTGKSPKASDTVEVHYHGTLINGVVFDSSVQRNKKIEFPLNRVISGWTEGLQLMKEGGKIKLIIPSELAYGDNGSPPKIPGGSTLIFEVELFKVK